MKNIHYFSEDTFDLFIDKWGVSNRKSHTFKGGIDYTPNESTSLSFKVILVRLNV